MSELCCFCVTLHLEELFKDKRSCSKLYVNSDKVKTIGDFLIKIRSVFHINDAIDLFVKEFVSLFYIPPCEDIRILQTNNTVVIKPQCNNASEENDTTNSKERRKKKCKKRKLDKSSDNLDLIEAQCNGTVQNLDMNKAKAKIVESEKETEANILNEEAEANDKLSKYIESVGESSIKEKKISHTFSDTSACHNKGNIKECADVEDTNHILEEKISKGDEEISEADTNDNTIKRPIHRPSFSTTAFQTVEGISTSIQHKFIQRKEIKPMEISRIPKIVKSVKVINNTNTFENESFNQQHSLDTSSKTLNRDMDVNNKSELNNTKEDHLQSLKNVFDSNSQKNNTNSNHIGQELNLVSDPKPETSLLFKMDDPTINEFPCDTYVTLNGQSTPIINNTAVKNDNSPQGNVDRIANISSEESEGEAEDTREQVHFHKDSSTENFATKRKRKRVRRRKKKSKFDQTFTNSVILSTSFDSGVRKPPSIKATPLIHIKFDDNVEEMVRSKTEENEKHENHLENKTISNQERKSEESDLSRLKRNNITQNGQSCLGSNATFSENQLETSKQTWMQTKHILSNYVTEFPELTNEKSAPDANAGIKILKNIQICAPVLSQLNSSELLGKNSQTLDVSNSNKNILSSNNNSKENNAHNSSEMHPIISEEKSWHLNESERKSKVSSRMSIAMQKLINESFKRVGENYVKSLINDKKSKIDEESTSSSDTDETDEVINIEETQCSPDIKSKSYVLTELDILKYPVMNTLPKTEDVIAFKVIVLTERYTPEVSHFIVAKVLQFEEDTKTVQFRILEGAGLLAPPKGIFSLENDDDQPPVEEVVYKWEEILEPRLLFP